MKKPLLCRLGFHKDRDIWRYPPETASQTFIAKCMRCGRQDNFITFFSQRKGPMHPDAVPGAENGRRLVAE